MEAIRQQWTHQTVGGKSFLEVGGLWGVVNEQVTTAHAAGASSPTQIDPAGEDLWNALCQRCQEAQIEKCRCIVGDINDPVFTETTEPASVSPEWPPLHFSRQVSMRAPAHVGTGGIARGCSRAAGNSAPSLVRSNRVGCGAETAPRAGADRGTGRVSPTPRQHKCP